jgi:hypothetical protein
MSDVSAGRLHLDAVADTTGFAREAKAKVEAATKNLRAKIKVQLETKTLIPEARAAAEQASKAAKVRLQAEIDRRSLAADIKTAAKEAQKSATLNLRATIDRAKFEADLLAAVKLVSNRYSIDVGVNIDTGAAAAQLAAFRASQRSLPIDMGIKVNLGNLGQTLSQLGMFPMIAGGVYLLGAAIGQLGGGLMAVASAAAQAVSTLAALPNLLGAVVQGAGVLLAGFSGIGDAVGALGEQDKASAANSKTAADIRVDSAARVKDAQRALADAYHNAGDAARQANYAIKDAEWNLARAQEAAKEAQEGVNEARKAAREYIDDLNDSLERAVLTEENAANRLAKAKQALQDVQWDASATEQERRDAALAVKNAEQDLKDSKKNREEISKEAKKANKDGVKGSEQLQQAKERQRDANHSLMLAERQLSEARHQAADSARSSAAAISSAQRSLAEAQKGSAEAIDQQNASLGDQMEAFNKLTPSAQRFARFLFDTVMPRFRTLRDNIQEAILPPIQQGISAAMPWIDTLEQGLVDTADVIGDLVKRVGELFGSEGFSENTAAIMASNNRVLESFGDSVLNIIEALSDLAVVAGPTLAEPFARWVGALTASWKESAKTGRETGSLRDKLERAKEAMTTLKDIAVNLGGAIHGIGVAATPSGNRLLESFEKTTKRWDDWANSGPGQDRLGEWFTAIEPAFREFGTLISNLSLSISRMAESGGGPVVGFLKVLNGLLTGLNVVLATPYVGKFVGWMLTLAGAGGALLMLSGVFAKFAAGLSFLSKITGITKLFQAFRMSLLGTRIGLMLLNVQTKLVAAGQKVLRGALIATQFVMKTMGKAAKFMFGPWGLAIMAAVGLFVLLYKKVDWFRKGVDWVVGKVVDAFMWIKDAAFDLWDELFGHSIFPDIIDGLQWFYEMAKKIFGFVVSVIKGAGKIFAWLWDKAVKPALAFIGKAITALWTNFYKPYLMLLWSGLKTLGRFFAWLWDKAVKPALVAIRKAVVFAWTKFIKPALIAFGRGLRVLGKVIAWLWDNVIQPAWTGIRKVIAFAWTKFIKPALVAFGRGLKVLGKAVEWLWEKAIKPAWAKIKSNLSTVWNFVRDKVFDPMAKFVKKTIPDAFKTAKDNIKKTWDKIKGIAAKPVEFLVETVYSDGIRKVVNAIPGVKDLPPVTFNYAKGTSSILPGYTPGRDPHNFVSTDGQMALNLSGGEGILRPEVARALGSRTIDGLNVAARRGGAALRGALSGLTNHGRKRQSFADGGILGGVRKTLNYWLGGVLPLPGATSIAQHMSGYSGMPWAGDLNWPGRTDYGKPIVAWKGGKVSTFDIGDTSYGRGVTIAHPGGGSTLYAHMSKIAAGMQGASVRAGQTVGYVGDYGNTGNPPTSHLHFEVRSGGVNLGDAAGSGSSAAEAAANKKASSWREAISKVKEVLTSMPRNLAHLAGMEGWGEMMRQSAGAIGSKVVKWVNDKIPNSIRVPKAPDIPLPDNPIFDPFKYDRGGDWPTGTLGANMSGKTETVFTNQNIVDLSENLARIATGLKAQVIAAAGGNGQSGGVHIDNLELSALPETVPQVLGDLSHTLRLISLGGGHHARTAS